MLLQLLIQPPDERRPAASIWSSDRTCSMSSQSSLPTKIISLGRRWRVPPPLTRNQEVRLISAFTFGLYHILQRTGPVLAQGIHLSRGLFQSFWRPDRHGESLKLFVCACVVYTVAILGITAGCSHLSRKSSKLKKTSVSSPQ